jgi:hypothetical protein
MRSRLLSGCILGFLILGVSISANAINWPLRISSNGNYLEDQSGVPFLIIGDSAQSLIAQLNPSQVKAYLDDRQTKGYTTIKVNLIEREYGDHAPNNYDNVAPFTNGPSDWTIRNEAYWAYVDSVLNEAKNRDMLVLAFVSYIGYGCGSEGWCAEMQNQTDAAMTSYGEFLGNRYKDQGNILWINAGDANANDYPNAYSRVAALSAGIKNYDKNHLHSAASAPGRPAMDDYNDLIDINAGYTYGNVQSQAQTEYQRNRAKPLYFDEGFYENEHNSSLLDWQGQALIFHLGGALVGQVFGNCPIWNFGASSASSFCNSATTWPTSLDSAGSISQGNIGRLMRSRPWWGLIPDYSNVVVTSSKGSELNYHATAREIDGKTVLVWCPTTDQVMVDMTKINGGQAKAWWWNPIDNTAKLIGTYATTGAKDFTPDSAGMVLVLDDVNANFSPPGQDSTGSGGGSGGGGDGGGSGGGGGGSCFINTIAP